jgi:hypothetical protein
VLAVTSLLAGWELIGLPGWVWLALCLPEAILIGGLFLSAQWVTTSATAAGGTRRTTPGASRGS